MRRLLVLTENPRVHAMVCRVLYLLVLARLALGGKIIRDDHYRGSQTFGYTNTSFVYKGTEIQLLGGQMDPQRVPAEYWRDRLEKAKAMGLNTVFSYLYWNELETSPGVWDWQGVQGMNNIARFYQTVQEAGMHAVLRPGPYICGERDWGGFPAWLSQVNNLTVRTTNPQYLELSNYYLGNLSQQIGKYQVTEGGPILLVQVENEYGNYGSNHAYTQELSDIIAKHFSVLRYTNDGGSEMALDGGHVHDDLAEIDGDPYFGFGNRSLYVTDLTSQGPNLDGEYYVKWLTTWGPNASYPIDSGIQYNDQEIFDGLSYIMHSGGSFSLYMFHGGSNFGFGNGALDFGQYYPVTQSYDYAAPLNESGRKSVLYDRLVTAIMNHTHVQPPPFPDTPDMLETDLIPLTPVSYLFDHLPESIYNGSPLSMEELGQSRGFTLYRYTVPATVTQAGLLTVGDGPRDRILVYINETRQGVIDNLYTTAQRQNVTLNVTSSDVVNLFVENQGRVDYSTAILDQRKGIVGRVLIGDNVLGPWTQYSYPIPVPPGTLSISNHSSSYNSSSSLNIQVNSAPVWYYGTLDVPAGNCGTGAADTYLTIEGGIKGVLYVNGINLGRYWTVGPQQSLYVPGVWLKEQNEIVVLELEPQPGMKLTAKGSGERLWYNNPDPDCPGCTSVNPNPDYQAQK